MIDPNAPAFPRGVFINPNGELVAADQDGLSIRAEFAKAAMQGMLANSDIVFSDFNGVADFAAKHADALIARLNKENKT